MASDIDYGSWVMNHPVKAILLFTAVTVIIGPIGPGAAWLTEYLHWVSPDNVAAGFGMGIGGALLGLLAAFAVVGLVSARDRRRRAR